MNKRQKKKAYKKRYGHNPPTKDYLYKTYGLDTAVVADRMAEAFRNVFTVIRETIEAVAKNITTVWEKTKETIQTMSDEEYAEFLEELKPEKDQAAAAGQEKEGGI